MKYDPKKDLYPVDQVGFLDLREVAVSGVIPGDINFHDEDFNRANPADMMHRPDDTFAALRQRDYVRSSLSAQAQTEQVTE